MAKHLDSVSVVGAAAVWDYLAPVEKLPGVGGIVKVLAPCRTPYPGGCAPNIATGLARLGLPVVRLHYPLGEDAAENELLQQWAAGGVDCRAVQVLAGHHSGAAWQFMQPDGCTMCFAYAGAAEHALPDLTQALGEWVVVAPVLNQFTRPLLEKALLDNRRVISTGIYDKSLVPHITKLGALLVNHHEAEGICSILGKGSLGELARHIGKAPLYVTYGKKGARVFFDGQVSEVPIIEAGPACDVTGAGDSFTAGVVFGLVQGMHPVQAAYVGACCSSFVVAAYGGQARQADWPAVRRRLGQYAPEIGEKLAVSHA